MNFLTFFNDKITLFVIFPAILLLGCYFTFWLKGVQFSRLKMSFFHLLKSRDKGEGNISHYEAVASVLAGSFGTGNISGMAVALTIGGPGALFWMWIVAFLGAVIQYASCLLGVKYRAKNEKGEYMGGPMYYLRDALGHKKLSIIFALLVIIAAFAVGNFVQLNSVALPLAALGIPPLATGVGISFFVALVVLGGAKRVSKVAAAVVPFMAFLYLGGALIILAVHFEKLPAALGLIVQLAFGKTSALLGGAVGFGFAKAVISGFGRAIFATDAGTGSVPILQAGARTHHPVIDGVVSLIAPFLVMVVCSATVLVLIVTGAWQAGWTSTNMITAAFESVFGRWIGHTIVIVALVLFAYTTVLAWGTCALRATEFLFGRKALLWMQLFFIFMIPIGALLRVELVWILADLALSGMLILNLIALTGLRKEVIQDTKQFFFAKIRTSLE